MRKVNIDEAKQIYRLSRLLKQTDDALTKSRENELRKFGITPEQAAALVCICSLRNKATSAEISRWLFRDESSILVLLRRMVKLGLVKKKTDRSNKHIIRIMLTDKGYEAYQHAIEFIAFYDIFHGLTKRKRQQLWSLLEILRGRAFNVLRLDIDTYSGLFNQELVLDIYDNNRSPK